MKIEHVRGEDKGKIFLYTLSTCIWCRRMKRWLNNKGLEYSYVDVDLAPGAEHDQIMEDVRKWNPACSFPTVVINDETCVSGYDPEKLEELLGI